VNAVPWWARRAIGIPVVVLATAVVLLAWPLVAAVEALVLLGRLVGRRPRWRALRLASFAVVFAACEWLCLLRCLLLWLGSPLPGRRDPGRWRAANAAVLATTVHTLVVAAGRLFDLRLRLDAPRGAPLDVNRPLIALSRHAGPGASLVLIDVLIQHQQRIPRIVLRSALRLDPAVDVMLTRIGAAFVGHGGAAQAIGTLAADLQPHDALVIFPEGNDWTPARHRSAVDRLRRKGRWARARTALQRPNVLPPRPAGTLVALANAPYAQVAVFLHTGHDDLLRPSALWQALPLERELHMAWWPQERPDPDDPAACARWLDELWGQVDGWVAEHTGSTG
jgi:1-acyl-sn-glycerol-3-phosphate acyltransferase